MLLIHSAYIKLRIFLSRDQQCVCKKNPIILLGIFVKTMNTITEEEQTSLNNAEIIFNMS